MNQQIRDVGEGPPFFGVLPWEDWASVIIAKVMDDNQLLGYVLVQETRKPDPSWKFPGGKKSKNQLENPRQTALGELKSETGIEISDEQRFRFIAKLFVPANPRWSDARDHYKLYFELVVSPEEASKRFQGPAPIDGEVNRIVSQEEFDALLSSGDFFRSHARDIAANKRIRRTLSQQA